MLRFIKKTCLEGIDLESCGSKGGMYRAPQRASKSWLDVHLTRSQAANFGDGESLDIF